MTKQVGDERAIRLRNPDAYELHSVAKNVCEVRKCRDIAQRNDLPSISHTLFKQG